MSAFTSPIVDKHKSLPEGLRGVDDPYDNGVSYEAVRAYDTHEGRLHLLNTNTPTRRYWVWYLPKTGEFIDAISYWNSGVFGLPHHIAVQEYWYQPMRNNTTSRHCNKEWLGGLQDRLPMVNWEHEWSKRFGAAAGDKPLWSVPLRDEKMTAPVHPSFDGILRTIASVDEGHYNTKKQFYADNNYGPFYIRRNIDINLTDVVRCMKLVCTYKVSKKASREPNDYFKASKVNVLLESSRYISETVWQDFYARTLL